MCAGTSKALRLLDAKGTVDAHAARRSIGNHETTIGIYGKARDVRARGLQRWNDKFS